MPGQRGDCDRQSQLAVRLLVDEIVFRQRVEPSSFQDEEVINIKTVTDPSQVGNRPEREWGDDPGLRGPPEPKHHQGTADSNSREGQQDHRRVWGRDPPIRSAPAQDQQRQAGPQAEGAFPSSRSGSKLDQPGQASPEQVFAAIRKKKTRPGDEQTGSGISLERLRADQQHPQEREPESGRGQSRAGG